MRIAFALSVVALSGLCLGGASARAASGVKLTSDEQAWLQAHPVIRVAPEADYPPFVFVDEDRQLAGLSVDYLRLVESQLGIHFTMMQPDSLAPNLRRAQTGEADVITSLKRTVEREAYLRFTAPYVEVPAVLLVRKDYAGTFDPSAFTGERVAVGKGYAVHRFLQHAYPALHLVPEQNDAEVLHSLASGKVEAAVVDAASATYQMNALGIDNLRMVRDIGFVYPLSLAVRKDWPQLAGILDKALKSVPVEQRRDMYERWIHPARQHRMAWRNALWIGGVALAAGLMLTGGLWFTRKRHHA